MARAARHLDSLDPNNLRLLFGVSDFARDVAAELREDLAFGAVIARALLPHFGRDEVAADDIFGPRRPLSVPALAGKRIGLVISGGSGATASLCGVRRAFEDAGLEVAAISACSGSMLFAPLWALGLDAREMASFWLKADTREYIDPDWAGFARAAVQRFRGFAGALRGEAIERTLERRFGKTTFAELRTPLASVAWNIDLNTVEELGSKATPNLTIARAVRIALALPPFIQPVTLGRHVYADGGIVDVFPAGALLHLGEELDYVFGINCYFPEDFEGEPVEGWLEKPWSIMEASRQLRSSVHLELARARRRELGSKLILLNPVPFDEVRGAKFYEAFLDRTRWPNYMRLGYASARQALEQLEQRAELSSRRAQFFVPVPSAGKTDVPIGRALSSADAAWLKMDEPTNPMMITAALFFDELPARESIVGEVERTVAAHPRLRERVVITMHGLGSPHWQLDPELDVRAHVKEHTLPAPGDEGALRSSISTLMSTPLDPARPLWDLHLVRGPNGGGTIICRIQHCVADGAALMRVLETFAGSMRAEPPRVETARERPAGLAVARDAAGALGRTLLLRADPPTIFKGVLGREKRGAWSSSIPLERLRALARVHDAKINDLLLAATAGALRSYALAQKSAVQGLEIRAVVPVDLRGPDDKAELGNRFGLVFAPLPIGEEAPLERLSRVKRAMRRLKASSEAPLMLHVLEAAGAALPARIEHSLADLFGKKATLVVTNVRGPTDRISIAGKTVRRIVIWVPQSAHLALGVGIFSYAGEVTIGIAGDSAIVPEPEKIAAQFERELAAFEAEHRSAPAALRAGGV